MVNINDQIMCTLNNIVFQPALITVQTEMCVEMKIENRYVFYPLR